MAVLGQTGSQAPQLMHSSVILLAMDAPGNATLRLHLVRQRGCVRRSQPTENDLLNQSSLLGGALLTVKSAGRSLQALRALLARLRRGGAHEEDAHRRRDRGR